MSLAEMPQKPGREIRAQTENPRTAAAQEGAQRSSDHLYVMQNASGRIKIGRSRDPERRRRDLEHASGQHIVLVAVFKGRGDEERGIHAKLSQFRGIGEWFSASVKATDAICQTLGESLKFRLGQRAMLEDARAARAERRALRESEPDPDVRAALEKHFGPFSPEWDRANEAEEDYMDGECSLEELNELRQEAGLQPFVLKGPGPRPFPRKLWDILSP